MTRPTAVDERMRIFVSTDTVGGVWDYSVQLSRELWAAGHEVRLAVIGEVAADRIAALPESIDVIVGDYRLEWMPDSEPEVAAGGAWLSRSAREWGPDVVHLNQMAYAVEDFGAPTLVVVHSDVLSWFSETLGIEAPPEWDGYARMVRAGLAAADLVAAPSAYQSDLTARHFGRGADRVIHNGVGPGPAARRPRRRKAPLVVSAGRAWDEAKGMSVLDAAAGLLGTGGPALHLLGETTGPRGETFVAEHAIAHGRVPREQVDDWLSRASVYVGASLYEPFGLAPLEAALHGAALVLSDIPSFRELWDGCAVFCPPGDPQALARVLEELSPDLQRCGELGRAARARALERYTADRFALSYLELYTGMRLHLETNASCV